jgi:Zn-dependent peptidase ImmA (M78 family)
MVVARREALIELAKRDAVATLRRYGVEAPEHITVERWAEQQGIEIEENDLDGASAQLVRHPKRTKIILPRQVTDRGARRFSIVHEMYHLMKRHPSPTPMRMCTPGARDDRRPIVEIVSSVYASEVLLPEALVAPWVRTQRVTMEAAQALATAYDVSILAAAIRFAELSPERCAAVFSARGKVRWCAPSATFPRRIERGVKLAPGSLARTYFDRGTLDAATRVVPARAWLDTAATGEIIEHAICSHEHRTVLSFLWIEPVAPG